MKADNELIAEFMGKPRGLTRYDTSGQRSDHPIDYSVYQNSWDWLMPVVEKIESLGFSVIIKNDSAIIERTWSRDFKAGYFLSSLGDSKILAVQGVVNQFIKWYNSQKS